MINCLYSSFMQFCEPYTQQGVETTQLEEQFVTDAASFNTMTQPVYESRKYLPVLYCLHLTTHHYDDD